MHKIYNPSEWFIISVGRGLVLACCAPSCGSLILILRLRLIIGAVVWIEVLIDRLLVLVRVHLVVVATRWHLISAPRVLHIFILFLIHFLDGSKVLLVLHLKVSVFGISDDLVDSVNLKSVCMDLRLVVFKFKNHFFKLFGPFFQVLLVNYQLFCDFWTTLLSQDVFKLDVKLFLFLNQHVFLRNFFSLGNQPFLKTLDLLDQLVSFNVSWLKFAPSMNIQRFIQFVSHEFHLLLLLKQFFLK